MGQWSTKPWPQIYKNLAESCKNEIFEIEQKMTDGQKEARKKLWMTEIEMHGELSAQDYPDQLLDLVSTRNYLRWIVKNHE